MYKYAFVRQYMITVDYIMYLAICFAFARLGFRYTMELNFAAKLSFMSRVENTKARLVPRAVGKHHKIVTRKPIKLQVYQPSSDEPQCQTIVRQQLF